MSKILIIEDDSEIAMLERDYLEIEGFETTVIADGEAAAEEALRGGYDLLLLDLMLPGCNGYDICRRVRDRIDVPILMVTARTDSVDKIRGLGLGADDYIAKPFRPRELVSRIRSVLRRCGKSQAVVTLGNVTVDTEKGVATKGGNDLYLSALEYRLLLVFVNNRGKVLSRSKLLEEIWDVAGDFVNDNTLTVYIKRLREKIEDDPQSPQIIRTVRGMGYKVDG